MTNINLSLYHPYQVEDMQRIGNVNNGGLFECNGKMVPEVIEVVFLKNSLVPQRVLSLQSYPVAELDHPANWRKKDLPVNFFK